MIDKRKGRKDTTESIEEYLETISRLVEKKKILFFP